MAEKKSRAWLWILLAFLAVGLFGVVVLLGIASLFGGSPGPVGEGVLQVVIRGPVREGPATDPLSELMASLDGSEGTLWDLRQGIKRAAKDPKVLALRLDLMGDVGWAVADELIALLEELKAAGKPVYAYIRGEFAGDQQYYIATAADHLWLAPATGLLVNGLRFEAEFYRGSLEKLHVEPHYLMMEEYKSAGEPFTRNEMSEYFREQLEALGGDIQDRMIAGIAERRELDPEEVAATVDLGLLTAPEALARGWVDRLGFADELRTAMAEALGKEEYTSFSLTRYLASSRGERSSGRRVALVFGEGIITATSGGPFQEPGIQGDRLATTLWEAIESESIDAIVFRVNSPGGSPVGSDHIWRAIEQAQEAGKPVVVSMSDVAGSGGYWVAMGADRIVAHPTTITGSIGVVFGKLNIRGFYEWLGANVSDVTLARNADILSFFEPMETEHAERFRAWMNQVYDDFRVKVADGRNLDEARVAEIAKGRVWSGVAAKELGLVDELGGLDEALVLARELAGLPDDAGVQVFPRQRSLLEVLASGDLELLLQTTLRPKPTLSPAELLLKASRAGELPVPRPWVLMPTLRID